MIHKWRMHTKILLLCLGVAALALLFQTFWFQKTSSGMIYQEKKDESFHMLQNMQDDIYNLAKRMETILIKVYNEREFMQDLKSGTGIEQLKEVYYREAYTIATTNFETADNVVALYLYNADHEIISTYRRAVTPRHNYPLDIYEQEAAYNAGIVKEYAASEETAMLISSYYNTSREREIIRFVLMLYHNGNFKHKIGYVVCDVDSRNLLSIMEKYSTGEDSYLWLQPKGDRPALSVGTLEKTEIGKLENLQKSIQSGIMDENEMIESSDRVFFQLDQNKYNFGAYSLMPQEIFYENQKILFRYMIFIVAVMLCATVVITFFVTKTLTKPLEKMADTAQKITEGNTKLRMEEPGEDEIGQLGRNFNEMLDTVEELIAREYQAKLLLNQAEYNALQAQINPHFLYNTLDTMGSIADMQGCGQVSALCQSLSDMFRYSMDIRHPFSTVAKEMAHLNNYIYVMEVRMQDHIQYEFDIEEAVLDDSIPRLSVQPLVENALNHGLRNSKEKKIVRICAEAYQGNLRIVVEDNGAGMPQKLIEDLLNPEYAAEKEEGKSIGIYNINMRMKMIYGENYGLSIASEPGTGTRVTLLAARKENIQLEMEHLKILIADDEYWIREKLRNMIDWGSYGLTLLEPAKDGEEVLERMKCERPDILITDINMPFVSGVDLLRAIQEQYPDTVSFVISGYDDFEYVKESFLAGSINYLVKPVTRIDLVNAIVKALDLIAKRNDEKQEFLKASSLIQDREFSQLLEHRETSAPGAVTGGRMNFTGAKLVFVKIHDMADLAVHFHYDMNNLSFQLKQKIKELLQQNDAMVFQYIYRSNEFILISEADSRALMRVAEKILDELQKFTASPITVVVNQNACTMDTIYQAYVQAVSLLMARKYTKESILICSSWQGGQAETGQIQNRISEAQMQELRTLWKSRNQEAIRRMMFGTIGIERCSSQEWQYLEVKQTMRRIVNTWEEAFAGTGENHVDYEEMAEAADRAVEKLDVSCLCGILQEMIGLAADAAIEDGTERAGSLVRQAAAYIDQYYYEPLTLTGLAECYHMENSYFSRIFRKEMGENLSHYLARTRIEKAKEYIKSGNVNMTEIAFMVGYDDYTYFSKVFKKFTGVSPRNTGIAGKQAMRKDETKMKQKIVGTVFGCAVLLLAGCSGTEPVEPKEKVVHLSVLAGQSTSDAGIEEMIDEKLAEAIPNVKLDWECVDWGESFHEELSARFAAGDIPDILIGKAQDAGNYSATGNLAPIEERFVEALDEMARESVTVDGTIYGIPYNYWYQGVIYNKEIFAQYGLKAPKTREELELIVEVLESNGETPFAGHYQENWTVGNITMQFMLNNIFAKYPAWGNDFRSGTVNYTGNEIVADCMECGRYMFEHTWEDAMLIDQAVCDSRFEQRGAAMYLTGSWSLQFSNLYQQADYYGIFPYPNLTGDAKLIRETNMTFMKSAVTEYGEEVDRIFELLLTDEELMGEILDYTQTFSVKKDYKANFKSCLQEELDSYEEKGQIIEANRGNTQLFWQFQNDVAAQELLWLRGNQELSDVLEYADEHRMESGI